METQRMLDGIGQAYFDEIEQLKESNIN
jgi:hypothetical protein